MKITNVSTQLYEITMDRPIGDANNPEGRQQMAGLAVFLESDEGVTGIALGSPGAAGQIKTLTEHVLMGRDPRGVQGLWKEMVDFVFKGGNRGGATAAISALDIALWDMKARLNDEPLWKTLGASTRHVKAYGSGIDMPLSDDEIYALYARFASKGINAGKLKIGLDMEMDLRRIAIMEEALSTSGKKPELLIDVNEYWSPKQTIRFMHQIEDRFDITWIEEPARRWDWQGLRQVTEGVRASVASGENLDSMDDYVPLIANRAVDVLNLGSRATGITGAMQIAHLAHAFQIPVSMMNCAANFMAPVGAVLPNHIMMEVLDNGRDAVLTGKSQIEDGWIVLNDEPGLGFTFDSEKLAQHAVDAPSAAAGPSPWGQRRGAALYLVGPKESVKTGGEE